MLGTKIDEEGILLFTGLERIEPFLVLGRDRDLALSHRIVIDVVVEEEIRHVGVSRKEDAVKFVDFPFVPVGGAVYCRYARGNGLLWIDLQGDFHAARRERRVEKIHQFESVGIIGAEQAFQGESLLVKEADHSRQPIRTCLQGIVIPVFGIGYLGQLGADARLEIFGKTVHHVLSARGNRLVPVIFSSSFMKPSRSASGLGGHPGT